MVEHVQPTLDRTSARPRRGFLAGALDWASREALLFTVVALFLVGAAAALPRELFQDTWMAVLGGREIVEHGLPSTEVLTIWTHGRDWVDQQWLAQLAFYGLYALGGIKVVLAAHLLATAAAFTLAVVVARSRGASTRSICWVAAPAYFLLSWGAWNARAQSLAVLLFVAVVALLIRDAHAPSRRVFFVFPLLVLWANIHGTALTGAALVALSGAMFALERREQPRREWLPRSAVLMVAPFLCLFASPYAAGLPQYYETMMFNSGFREWIVEWKPTAPNFQTAPFYLLAFLAVWLLGRTGRKRLLPFEQALLLATLLLGLQSLRAVIWFTLVALMLMPFLLDDVWKPSTSAIRFRRLSRVAVLSSVAVSIAVIAVVSAKPSSWFERSYPSGVLVAYDRLQAHDPHLRVFANEAYGDWLLLRRPELRGRLAFDIRFELMSKRQLERLAAVRWRVDGWRRVVAPYGLFVLKSEEKRFARALLAEPESRLEFRGQGAVVISRHTTVLGNR
jgi:hypothetical protein